MAKHYSDEFKEQAVDLVLEGEKKSTSDSKRTRTNNINT